MSLAKKALLAVAAFIVVTLISLTLAYKLIDDSVIERNALKALQDTLKRDVSVTGEFTLSRSLHPTLRTTGVRVASAEWDKDNALLEAQKLEIGIALLDLLVGNITINNIVFEDAIINMKRNAEGASNLDFPTDETSQPSSSTNAGAPIDVIDVKIKNLTLNYTDLQTNYAFVYALESLSIDPKDEDTINIVANSHYDQQPIRLESEMCRIRHLLSGQDCTLSANIDTHPFNSKIKGNVNIARTGMLDLNIESSAGNINELIFVKDLSLPDTQKIDIATQVNGAFHQLALNNITTKVELENTRLQVTGKVASINTLNGVDISFDASTSEPAWLSNYQEVIAIESIKEFKASGDIQGDNGALRVNNLDAKLELPGTKVNSTGTVTIQPELLLALNLDASGKHPAWLDELQQAIVAEEIDQFSIKAEIDNQQNSYNIKQLNADVKINGTNTSAQGDISVATDNAIALDLSIKSTGKSLQDLTKFLQQSLPETEKYNFASQFKFNNNTIDLSDLEIVIDDTKLQGNSNIELSSPPNIKAEINADTLNIEHLLALGGNNETDQTDSESSQTKTSDSASSLFSSEAINLEWLNTADTNILLAIKNLIYKDAKLNDIKAIATAKNNVAALEIASLNYLDANVTSKTSVNANNHTYSHVLFTENFDLGQLLNQTNISNTLQGKIDASIDVNSTGKTSKQIANNANGKFTTVMTEGTLKDAPIDLLASNLLVELMPGKSKKDTTKVECMFIQFSGENGIFKSDAVLLNTENIVMTTDGNIDLTSEKLNLLLSPKPKNVELFTLDANIRVAGDLTDPSFSLDKGSLFKKLLKTAATVALGPAALAIPFTNMGGGKTQKCFDDVASTTTKAVEAQQEAERIAREQAEKEKLEKELQEKAAKEAQVEPLDP